MTTRVRKLGVATLVLAAWFALPSTASAQICVEYSNYPTLVAPGYTAVVSGGAYYNPYGYGGYCDLFSAAHEVVIEVGIWSPNGYTPGSIYGYNAAEGTVELNAGSAGGGFGGYTAMFRLVFLYFDGYEWQTSYGDWAYSDQEMIDAPTINLSSSGGTLTVGDGGGVVTVSASVPSELAEVLQWSGCTPDYTNVNCSFSTAEPTQIVVTASLAQGEVSDSATFDIVEP